MPATCLTSFICAQPILDMVNSSSRAGSLQGEDLAADTHVCIKTMCRKTTRWYSHWQAGVPSLNSGLGHGHSCRRCIVHSRRLPKTPSLQKIPKQDPQRRTPTSRVPTSWQSLSVQRSPVGLVAVQPKTISLWGTRLTFQKG